MNYMCTATCIGTLSELLRIPELILFCIYTCCLQSPGELRSLKMEMQYEFQLGVQYAYVGFRTNYNSIIFHTTCKNIDLTFQVHDSLLRIVCSIQLLLPNNYSIW